jgi:small subunit ribosomal protein S15
MDREKKAAVTQAYQRHKSDTGSSEVQIAILTSRIEELTEHLKVHKKDHSSRHGLIKMVSTRRKLLDYVKSNNEEKYQEIIKSLKLRR